MHPRPVTRGYNVQYYRGDYIFMSKNRIIYDWLTFTTQIHSVGNILDLLGLSEVSFIKLDRGMNGYPECIFFGGISICYGGREDMGVCVCMSGKGCRTFEEHGNGDWNSIFVEILDNYSDDSSKRKMNISRLDIAYDDFDGLLDIKKIAESTFNQNYVSRFSKGQVLFDFDKGNVGITCNFGSVRSDTYIRIYDKKVEQKREDIDHWIRCEIQLRGASSLGFIMLGGDICANYFGVLNNYLRFVDPSDTDTNKRRWKTSEWWDNFIESYDSVSIFARPGTEYNIFKLENFVFGQCTGAVCTMIDIVGVEEFLKKLQQSKCMHLINPKYKDLKNQMGTSSDGIIEFLRERCAL